ncbi:MULTISPECIES: signal peptide peptidase SppA [unclassified Methanosarcina]|uniref:signal peptide peptidase SppA n=1 Tax=unclassified Methanosarcina TaxID=2644672 RepID=UPI000615932A|nr:MULTISPECIES: signal peptide peptidase SppA [unclassified Methanosarcina]AKB17224.1 Periplasmic serine protease [Methanosarcina sp. WWM596]AKB20620.1 Periplasmic serine protease [Methanosarcina sp. WH1]
MNDENVNSEGMDSKNTSPGEASGDDLSRSSASNKKETIIPEGGISESTIKVNSSNSDATPERKAAEKTDSQELSPRDPDNKIIEKESLSMNSGSSPSLQKKKRSDTSYVVVLLALVTVIIISMAAIFYGLGFGGNFGASEEIAVIYVQGTMLTGNVPAGLGYATSEEISENIHSAVADENVKAIVLRINSGGGSPAAAQEISIEIKKAQEQGVPVIVSMGDLGASAAYYISAPADYIFANPSTNTGSIGVIWTFENKSSYYEKEGIDYYISKSGEFKDMGGSSRGLTDEEKEYADSVVMESYENFVTQIAEGRNMKRSEVKKLADGRIYTGSRAKELGLVDDFGNLYDAIDKAAEMGNIQGEPRVVYMNRASLSSLLLGSDSGNSGEDTSQFVNYFEKSPYGKILAYMS